jgi:hypothetical protein
MNAFKMFVFFVPVPGCVLSFFLWRWRTSSTLFALFAVLLPLVYGYAMPGIATSLMGKWRFKGGIRLGGIYVHHGFIYASKLSLLLFACSYCLNPAEATIPMLVSAGFAFSATYALVAWIDEIFLLKNDMVQLNAPGSEMSPAERTFKYAPASFSAIGATYFCSTVWAYWRIVLENDTEPWRVAALFLGGFVFMFTVPSLVYGASVPNDKSR